MVCPKLRHSNAILLAAVLGLTLQSACKEESAADPAKVDADNDQVPDQAEDRNQNGRIDPGETSPATVDTDADGVPDELEVSTLACSKNNDRPFEVHDVPGADSMVLVDARVSEHSMLKTSDNKAPGASFVDPDLDVAAVIISKRPASGVAAPSAQRDYEQRTLISELGQIVSNRTRTMTTVQGYAAEQATYTIRTNQPVTARALAGQLAGGLLGGAQLTGTPAPGGAQGSEIVLGLLTILRSSSQVVILAAVAVGAPPSDDQQIRVDELTDGTNVARHESFTRHVCDLFEAKEQSKLDVIWVIDDSGSMQDDQEAVRTAADAFADVLSAARVDFRVGVTRTRAPERENSPDRGSLEGNGMTSDINEFKSTVVVGAQGGWEPGLQTGILAVDRLLPATAPGSAADRHRLREDAARVVIHMSDERDQFVECAACGECPDEPQERQRFCTDPRGQDVIDQFIEDYTMRNVVTFAIVGDEPNGCQQTQTRDDFEPGQGYVEVANATGGHFGSLCGDMRQNLTDIARAATGIASDYALSYVPASASIRVAKGPAGAGVVIPRSRANGWDYDAERNRIVFFGDARPKKGEEIVVGYRRWDWQGNTNRPPDTYNPPPGEVPATGPGSPSDPLPPDDPSITGGGGSGTPDPGSTLPSGPVEGCDACTAGTSCDPTLDIVSCEMLCGDAVCTGMQVCSLDYATCGEPDPGSPPANSPPVDACGGCTNGTVCNGSSGQCVTPCETTGCAANQICSAVTHVCQIPNF